MFEIIHEEVQKLLTIDNGFTQHVRVKVLIFQMHTNL